jgi:hypothetical protein
VHLPSVVDLLSSTDRWSAPWAGGSWTLTPTLRRLVESSVGPTPGGWLFLGVPVAAALALVVGRGWRLRWGIVGWALALGSWLTIASLARWSPESSLPSLSLLLVPAALGLALSVGAGVAAFEADVMGSVFGWRQVLSIVALVAGIAAVLPFLVAASDGRWRSPDTDVMASLNSMDREPGSYRTLWLGVPGDLPGASEVVDGDIGVVLTAGVTPDMADSASYPIGPGERRLLAAVGQLLSGETRTFGAEIAPFAVRHVVVLRSPDGRTADDDPRLGAVLDVLAEQLDLKPVEVAPGLKVYQSSLASPIGPTRTDGAAGHRILIVLQLIALVGFAAVAGGGARRPGTPLTEATTTEEVAP